MADRAAAVMTCSVFAFVISPLSGWLRGVISGAGDRLCATDDGEMLVMRTTKAAKEQRVFTESDSSGRRPWRKRKRIEFPQGSLFENARNHRRNRAGKYVRVEYYRTIITLYRAAAGGSYPKLILNSIDLKEELELIEAGNDRATTEYLVEEVGKVARAGADFGIIASNTPHVVFDAVAAASPIPLLSIVEVALEVAKKHGWRRPAIFGTRYTMFGDFYPKVFTRAGIELVRPPSDDAAYIHDKYMNELVNGSFLPEIRAYMLEIVDRMRAESGIDAVLLAGTELPLLLRDPEHNGVPLLDTMRAHVEAAVQRMLE